MKCGACTTVCPVYLVSGRESHAARGKQHLMERLAASERTAAFEELFSKCLLCGACRAICPRGLDTPELVVKVRSSFPRFSGTSFLQYLATKALVNPSLLSGLLSMGSAVNQLLASRLPAESGLRLRLSTFSPEILPITVASYLDSFTSEAGASGRKGYAKSPCTYFVGCLANHLRPEIGRTVGNLVAKISGSPPDLPRLQTCCGMAFLAAGNLEEARRLAQKNIAAFESNNLPILTSCASCYAHLLSYPDLFADEPGWYDRARSFAARLHEFSSYFEAILPEPSQGGIQQVSSGQSVFYHDPCHLRFQLNITAPPRRLLLRLPGLILRELADGPQCCGQGGLFHISHPDLSKQICDRLLSNFSELQAQTVVTTCSGCLLQWQQGLTGHGLSARAIHLAMLLNEYYD